MKELKQLASILFIALFMTMGFSSQVIAQSGSDDPVLGLEDSVVLAVATLEEIGVFTIYPNPTNDLLHIDVGKDFDGQFIKVYNLQGQNVIIKQFANHIKDASKEIRVSELKAGTYIVAIADKEGNKIQKRKFIKL